MICMFNENQRIMSSRVDMLCIALASYLCFQVKKISFISDDCFDLILNVSNTFLLNESFICSSLWINRANNIFLHRNDPIKSYIRLLLLMCGLFKDYPGNQMI